MHLDNLHLDPYSLGRVDPVAIGTLDAAVTLIRQTGDSASSATMSNLVEAVATDSGLDTQEREHILALLGIVASEMTVPPQERRRAGALSMLKHVAELLKPHAHLSTVWLQCAPTLNASFSH